MRIAWKPSLGVSSLLLAGIVLAGCASGPELPSPQQIEAARTRADHEALAAGFAYQADMARRDVAMHRDMDKSFATLRFIGQGGAYPDMTKHCAVAGSTMRFWQHSVTISIGRSRLTTRWPNGSSPRSWVKRVFVHPFRSRIDALSLSAGFRQCTSVSGMPGPSSQERKYAVVPAKAGTHFY